MSSEISVEINSLSKCYTIYDQPRDRLKQFLLPRLQKALNRSQRRYYREFWAVRNVELKIARGETVGIIGRNGSGKSTLLQMICGTLNPTQGTITTRGRIAALLELGSGFNPDFTGRENVYMNATVLGLSKEEIDARYEEIVDFADIGQFIDQPVKTYSSGMMVRLAFAVQAQVSPDILVVDEALAVGDTKFQAKCFERVKQLRRSGTSILLVTHSSEQIVTHCDRAVLLERGEILAAGSSKDVVNQYLDLLFGKPGTKNGSGDESEDNRSNDLTRKEGCELSFGQDVFASRPGYNQYEYRWGDGAARILDFSLSADGAAYPASVTSGARVILQLAVKFSRTLVRPIVGITVKTKEGVSVYGTNSEMIGDGSVVRLGEEGSVALIRIEFDCHLAPGDFFVSLGVATRSGEDVVPHDRRYDAIHFSVRPTSEFFGLANLKLQMTAEEISKC